MRKRRVMGIAVNGILSIYRIKEYKIVNANFFSATYLWWALENEIEI